MPIKKPLLCGLLLWTSLVLGQSPLDYRPLPPGQALRIDYAVGGRHTRPSDLARGPLEVRLYWQGGRSDTLGLSPDSASTWSVSVARPDTTVNAAVYLIQHRDTLSGKVRLLGDETPPWTAVLAVDAAGCPRPGAAEGLALIAASGRLSPVASDDWVLDALDLETMLYPQNRSARRLRYAKLIQSQGMDDETRTEIVADIQSALDQATDLAEALAFAAESYRLVGDAVRANAAETRLKTEFPQSPQGAMLRLQGILADTTQSPLLPLEAFVDSRPPQAALESALGQMAALYISQADSSGMVQTGDRLLAVAQTPLAASGLAGLAGALAENRLHTDRAEAYARRAVDLWVAQADALRPQEMDDLEWAEQRQQTEARYRDVLGWALYQSRRFNAALTEANRAVELGAQPGYALHRGVILEALGHNEDALESLARSAVYGGPVAQAALDRFRGLWNRTQGDTLGRAGFLALAANAVERDFFDRVLARRRVLPAPDFELSDVQGGRVRLSDQRGGVVVLCFWATWSRSSRAVLAKLDRLSLDWGNEVLFLTVATDPDPATVRRYLAQRGVALSVLFNKKADRDFGVRGLPMVYVIDNQGRIHFTHRGNRPDLTASLEVEMDDLLRRAR